MFLLLWAAGVFPVFFIDSLFLLLDVVFFGCYSVRCIQRKMCVDNEICSCYILPIYHLNIQMFAVCYQRELCFVFDVLSSCTVFFEGIKYSLTFISYII